MRIFSSPLDAHFYRVERDSIASGVEPVSYFHCAWIGEFSALDA
jgi:hypothetical protein